MKSDASVGARAPLDIKGRRMYVVCSWCGRVRCCDGCWRFLCPEDPVAEGRLLASHGICPDCVGKMEDDGK